MLSSQEFEALLAKCFTVQRVAKGFQVSTMTVYNWMTDKGLPAFRVPGETRGATRFVPQEVRQWAKREGLRFR